MIPPPPRISNFAFSQMVIPAPQMIPLFLTDARYYDERYVHRDPGERGDDGRVVSN